MIYNVYWENKQFNMMMTINTIEKIVLLAMLI